MIQTGNLQLIRQVREHNELRLRLVACVALVGGALGAGAVVISLLNRTKPWLDPEHMDLVPSMILSSAGLVAGAGAAALLTYVLVHKAEKARNPPLWVALGVGYGLMVPFLTGLLLPISAVFLDLWLGVIAVGEILPSLVGSLLRVPTYGFTHGAIGMYTGLLSGPVLGVSAWLIDMANASGNQRVSRYGSAAIALVLSSGFVVFVSLSSPLTLVKLG